MEISSKQLHILNQLAKSNAPLMSLLKVGDLVEGKILEKRTRMILVDLGKYGIGAIYGLELLNAGRDFIKNLKVGDVIPGKVINSDNEDGFVELSISEAGRQEAWQEISELKEKEEVIKVIISGFNSGGLIAKIKDVSAFLPVFQLAAEHYPRIAGADKNQISQALQKLVGQELNIKIIDINPRTNKLIISEKEAAGVNLKELIKNYQIGQIIEGIISGIADFGVFVQFTDNPAVEGLIYISEISHRLIDNPKEIVKLDQVIKAKIIEIKEGKIFLSSKVLEPNPWDKVGDYYKEKQTVKGEVYKFYPFGAVINLEHDLQGQIHVAEFGSLEEIKKQLELNKKYSFIIESIQPQEKRIVLKLASQ